MKTLDDAYDTQKKEFDNLIDMILVYAKKYGYAYLISIGKYHPEVDKTLIMDSFHEQDNCGLSALCQMLVNPGGPIAASMALAMIGCGAEIYEAQKINPKNKH